MSNNAPISPLKKIAEAITSFFTPTKTTASFLLVATVVIFLFGFFSRDRAKEGAYIVTPQSIEQSVAISGVVTASKKADLSFLVSGQVSFVGVTEGDRVTKGQILATLEAGNAQASLLDAQATLENRKATLLQLEQGSRKEELAIKEQALRNAENSLTYAYSTLPDVIKNADATTADVIKNTFAQLFIFTGSQYVLSFSSCDQRLQGQLEEKRTELENTLASFQKKSNVSVISTTENLDEAFSLAYTTSVATNQVISDISRLLLLPCSLANSSLDGYRTSLSSAKASMSSLFADLTTKRNTLTAAKNTFDQAFRDLELSKAGTNPYTLQAQRALVSQAEALVLQASSNLQKTIIRAPFDGVVSRVAISRGESVTTASVISLISDGVFEVEANIPEIDIAKIKVDTEAKVTLDAYGNDVVFNARVTRINPTATKEGTVPVYKAVITFDDKDARILQGMTANVRIVTEKKTNIYAIPTRYVRVVTSTVGQVIVVRDGKEQVQDVTLGIRGDKGMIEIIGGLLEGDALLSPKTQVREAQKQTN